MSTTIVSLMPLAVGIASGLAGIVLTIVGLTRRNSRRPLLAIGILLILLGAAGTGIGINQMIRARRDMSNWLEQQWDRYRHQPVTTQP